MSAAASVVTPHETDYFDAGAVAAARCVMDIVEKYRWQAEECEAIARRASEESQRERILDIAKVWRKLAADRERVLESVETFKSHRARDSGHGYARRVPTPGC